MKVIFGKVWIFVGHNWFVFPSFLGFAAYWSKNGGDMSQLGGLVFMDYKLLINIIK